MRIDDNTYSRVVSWLKIVLPLLALAILSTLFLVARTVDPAQQLPFAEVDVDKLAREQRIGAPNFTGVTAEGAAIALSAKTAAPDPENQGRVTGDTVAALIELPTGEVIDITAASMELDYDNGTAHLRRAVKVSSSAGYSLDGRHLEVALDRAHVRSAHPVTLTGAHGRIRADSFELRSQAQKGERYVLVFNGDVKLLYEPGS